MGDNWSGDKVNISVTEVLMGKKLLFCLVIFFLWLCKLWKVNVEGLHKNIYYFIVSKTFI
jgi:hypothetical protein